MTRKKRAANAPDQMSPQVFYDKLFSALEAGNEKGEKALLAQMAEDLELSNEPDLRAALIATVPPERAIVWLLSTDLLCDISTSMPKGTLSRATRKLVDANVLPLHTFTLTPRSRAVPRGSAPQQGTLPAHGERSTWRA